MIHFLHDKKHQQAPIKASSFKIKGEEQRDWQNLVCLAGMRGSDNNMRVLLGEGQIKNSRTTCGKTDTRLQASIQPWVMFHRAIVSGWTIISSRCPRRKTTPPPPSHPRRRMQTRNKTANLDKIINWQVSALTLDPRIYSCVCLVPSVLLVLIKSVSPWTPACSCRMERPREIYA